MIANKILPSFYLIEAEGKAIDSIIAGDFGISKIILGSTDFFSDLEATEAMQQSVDFITANMSVDWDKVTEKIDFNSEFFPSMMPTELTEEQTMELLTHELEAHERDTEMSKVNQMSITMTKLFDPMGDYVESRWAIESPEFKLLAKIGVNPDRYMQQKIIDKLSAADNFIARDIQSNNTIH
jgi:hypothetical protein